MKRLFLLRHGKAGFGSSDLTRPLAPRGHEDAHWLGQHLAQKGSLPDYILCSAATRTRETLTSLCLGAQTNPNSTLRDDFYLASANLLLDHLRQLDNTITAPMIIGHNPGLALLFHTLVDHPPQNRRLLDFPTCCLIILDFDITTWQAVKSHTGQLYDGLVAADHRKKETAQGSSHL